MEPPTCKRASVDIEGLMRTFSTDGKEVLATVAPCAAPAVTLASQEHRLENAACAMIGQLLLGGQRREWFA